MARCLWPLAQLYGALEILNRRCQQPKTLPVPVVSIGNLVAGGAGKTPTTIMLTNLLRREEWSPAILSRGYRGRMQNTFRKIDLAHDRAEDVGDEPLLLAHHAPVWVGKNRYQTGLEAIAKDADILLLDDGMQHYRLARTIDFCLVGAHEGIGNGWLLPAGPLRESWQRGLDRCDALVIVGDPAHLHIDIPDNKPVFHASIKPVVHAPPPQRVVAFAGIAYPDKFRDTLFAHGFDVLALHAFGDHQRIPERAINRMIREASMMGANVITTEKDWIKLTDRQRRTVMAYPIEIHIDDEMALLSFLRAHLPPAQSSSK